LNFILLELILKIKTII